MTKRTVKVKGSKVKAHERKTTNGSKTRVKAHSRNPHTRQVQTGLDLFAGIKKEIEKDLEIIEELEPEDDPDFPEEEEEDVESFREDLEALGLTQRDVRDLIVRENLIHSEVYVDWLRVKADADKIEARLEDFEGTDEEKKALLEELKTLRNESNRLYEIFRVIIEEEIVSECPEWEESFYKQLSDSDRFNFKTLEQLEKERGKTDTIENPVFDLLFNNEKTASEAPIHIELSENGNKIFFRWDNIGESGDRKVVTYRDDYGDFLTAVRDKGKGHWSEGKFIIDAGALDTVLKSLRETNPRLSHAILGDNNTKSAWKETANIAPEIVLEREDDEAIIFEVSGNNILLKGCRDKALLASRALNSNFSREVKKQGEKVKVYKAVEFDDDGNMIMPIGLLSQGYWLLKDVYNIDVAVADMRKRSPITNPDLKGIDLYSFQKEAVLESLIEGQGLIVSPTGTGKTMMAAGIISGFIEGAKKYEEETGRKVDVDSLFLVHRGGLRDQAYETFTKVLPGDLDIGLLDSKNFSPVETPGPDINIGTIQGMYTALKKEEEDVPLTEKDKTLLRILREAEVIFQDEAHHITAKSYDAVYDQNQTVHKFGLTATPSRKEQETILRIMKIGETRFPVTYSTAQDKGILMKPNVIRVNIPTSEGYRQVLKQQREGLLEGNPFWAKVIAQVETNPDRNDLIVEHARRMSDAQKRTIVFTRTKRHAEGLIKQMKRKHPEITPVLLHGGMSNQAIEQNKELLETGKTYVAVGTDSLLGEGFDMPSLDVLLGAGSSQLHSKIAVIQTAGRVMRVDEGKEQPLIFEYADEPQGFMKRVLKRYKHYNKYEAFDYTLEDVPSYYGNIDANPFRTKKARVEWVKQFIKPDEGTNSQKFQESEYYQHKRARKQLKRELKETEIIKRTETREKRKVLVTERLSDLTKDQIYDIAIKRNVQGRSKLTKDQLIRAIKYDKWDFDNDDLVNARYIAGRNQDQHENVLERVIAESIKVENKSPSDILSDEVAVLKERRRK